MTRLTPPRWSERLLSAWVPDTAMRDAILGDLQEELGRDTARLGAARARMRYRTHVAGIVGYVILDAGRMRTWSSESLAAPAAARAVPTPVASPGHRAPFRRADMGLMAAAFGVIGVGIVVNTMVFSATRHAPGTPGVGGTDSVLGLAALLLAFGSVAVAATLLCVGPRWLRGRACARNDRASSPFLTAGDAGRADRHQHPHGP